MLKKLTVFILILLSIPLCLSANSLGEVNITISAQPLYTHILKFDGSLNIKNGKAECYGAGRSQYTDTTTVVKVTLQKRVTGTTKWSSVCSWSDTIAQAKRWRRGHPNTPRVHRLRSTSRLRLRERTTTSRSISATAWATRREN